MNPNRRQAGINKVRRVMRVWRAGWGDPETCADDGLTAQIMLRTRVRCSGPCCGNPRRHYGQRTRQELRADDMQRVQENDILSNVLPDWCDPRVFEIDRESFLDV